MDLVSLRREMVKYSRRIWERQWVASHNGNLTARLDKNHILATPTAFSKNEVREEDLLVINLWSGKVTSGRHKPFSELPLHIECYKVRDDVKAVIHAHPPVLSGFSVAGIEVEPRITPEAVVSLGDRIPLAPCAFPGSLESRQQVRSLSKLYDVIMLGNHGVIASGNNLEQAYLRIELVEHIARIQQQAMLLGNLRLIPDSWVSDLMAKRKKAGLGPEGRGEQISVPPDVSSLPVEKIISAMVEKLKGE